MSFEFECMPYIAVIGDIKKSRMAEDRNAIQIRLKSILDEINIEYQNDISAKFLITLGDEFQGLLCRGENVMGIIGKIQDRLYPVQIRFGIGIGSITTEINSEMAIGADGPAYYRARNAVGYLKENEQKKKAYCSEIRIDAGEQNEDFVEALNTILMLMTVIKDQWSKRQREIAEDMLLHGDSQKDCALRLGVTQSTIQRGLAGGKYYAFREALYTVNKALEEINKDV